MTVPYKIVLEAWNIFMDVSVFMLFGFFIAGLLHAFFKTDQIKKYLGRGKIKPVFLSALFGIPIPLWSCGVIPVVTGLKKQGANNGAALSFMIATPESGVDSIAISWAMLDPLLTLIRPVAAFITAVSTGIAENLFNPSPASRSSRDPLQGSITGKPCSGSTWGCTPGAGAPQILPKPPGLVSRLGKGMRYAFGELVADIALPFSLGILIAGAITFFFPQDIMPWANNHPFISMLLMLVAGIPMYVCATSSTPIAAALILKGLNPGAALVFLLAGPATNAAAIYVVKDLFSKKSLVIYLVMVAVCSLFMGFLVDQIYSLTHLDPRAVMGTAPDIVPHFIQWGSAVILLVLLGFQQFKNLRLFRKHIPSHH